MTTTKEMLAIAIEVLQIVSDAAEIPRADVGNSMAVRRCEQFGWIRGKEFLTITDKGQTILGKVVLGK